MLEEESQLLADKVLTLVQEYVFIEGTDIVFEDIDGKGWVFQCKNEEKAVQILGYLYIILINMMFDGFAEYDSVLMSDLSVSNNLKLEPSLN